MRPVGLLWTTKPDVLSERRRSHVDLDIVEMHLSERISQSPLQLYKPSGDYNHPTSMVYGLKTSPCHPETVLTWYTLNSYGVYSTGRKPQQRHRSTAHLCWTCGPTLLHTLLPLKSRDFVPNGTITHFHWAKISSALALYTCGRAPAKVSLHLTLRYTNALISTRRSGQV